MLLRLNVIRGLSTVAWHLSLGIKHHTPEKWKHSIKCRQLLSNKKWSKYFGIRTHRRHVRSFSRNCQVARWRRIDVPLHGSLAPLSVQLFLQQSHDQHTKILCLTIPVIGPSRLSKVPLFGKDLNSILICGFFVQSESTSQTTCKLVHPFLQSSLSWLTDTHTDRQTGRQTDRQTDRHRDTQTDHETSIHDM